MFQKIDFFTLVVNDVVEATQYYRDTLGMEVDEANMEPGFYTPFRTNGNTIFAVMAGYPEPGIDAALAVNDADAQYAEWEANGVELLTRPVDMPFGRTFLFRTSEGHVLRAYSRLQVTVG